MSEGEGPAEGKRRSGRTGPVTKQGRKASSRNALKHGLRVPLLVMADYAAPVAELARLLVREGKDEEAALRLAEALLDVRRVREARHHAMIAASADPGALLPPPAYDRYERKALARRRRLLRDLER